MLHDLNWCFGNYPSLKYGLIGRPIAAASSLRCEKVVDEKAYQRTRVRRRDNLEQPGIYNRLEKEDISRVGERPQVQTRSITSSRRQTYIRNSMRNISKSCSHLTCKSPTIIVVKRQTYRTPEIRSAQLAYTQARPPTTRQLQKPNQKHRTSFPRSPSYTLF